MAHSPRPKHRAVFRVKIPGPYNVIREIGQGRFGTVYEVEHTEEHTHYALKAMPFSSDADFMKNLHEIEKLRKNQHRNIVQYHETLEGDSSHYLVLELCSKSLRGALHDAQLQGTNMNRIDVFNILSDTLAGLSFLHQNNLAYGDMKPDNILLAFDGTAKLGDFGGVTSTDTVKTSHSAETGTFQYWAPEMFQTEQPQPSMAADMWAFGCIALEMISGKQWISGKNIAEIAQSARSFNFVQAVTEMNVGEQMLFGMLLCANPDERISSIELIRTKRLQTVLGEETPLSLFRLQMIDRLQETLDKDTALKQEADEVLKEADTKERMHQEQITRLIEQVDEEERRGDQLKVELEEERVRNAQNIVLLGVEQDRSERLELLLLREQEEHALDTTRLEREQEKNLQIILQLEREKEKTRQLTQQLEREQERSKQFLLQFEWGQDRSPPKERLSPAVNPKTPQLKRLQRSPQPLPQSPPVIREHHSQIDRLSFHQSGNIVTRTNERCLRDGTADWSPFFISGPITHGVVSVLATILRRPSRPRPIEPTCRGNILFGLLSEYAVASLEHGILPGIGQQVSLGLSAADGKVYHQSNFAPFDKFNEPCIHPLEEEDRLRIEINMDSKPTSAQFFWNGRPGNSYVTGLPNPIQVMCRCSRNFTSCERF
ncbi:putative Membrane-associated tyrosine- and threonine-specific cdc2-inhibitory kinase [Blattamonas nauphoetae]|uniref:Membrane-associated tyrosine- and threonine-specific cdc2-inhibitory kinase n=1 Tax=Blattamonas nauphoetae TaxID=2049346 RepID=A0ABQ9XNP1_9EUKA|nr:putative Membrane-associated tyrosine- and threonine-specific cdc2-inhibitory kinase [Blattamonas nauphoetae]